MTNDAIGKVQASVNSMHGGERDRTLRYQNFLAWQIAQRQKEHGKEPSILLKTRPDETQR